MKKWKTVLQKGSIILVLIASVICVIYAWSFMTPYNNLELIDDNIPIYKNLQSINNALFSLSLWVIIALAIIVILGAFYRKKYYIENYVSIAGFSIFGVIASILLFVNLASAKSNVEQAIQIREDFLSQMPESMHVIFGEAFNTSIVDKGYLFVSLLLISVILVAINLMWSFILKRRNNHEQQS